MKLSTNPILLHKKNYLTVRVLSKKTTGILNTPSIISKNKRSETSTNLKNFIL